MWQKQDPGLESLEGKLTDIKTELLDAIEKQVHLFAAAPELGEAQL